MKIAEEALRQFNEAYAQIPISEARIRELPIELGQFAAVAEAVRPRLQFDEEISDFQRALEDLAWEG
jgi:hypothetical protein